jgi:hypothetical protein
MTRRGLSSLLSGEEQSLAEVWNWYEYQRALIGEEKSRVFAALSSASALPVPRYVGKTPKELEEGFAYQVAELGRLTVLGMLACTEALLRVDFIERVSNKKKDDVSRKFRKTYQRRGIEKIRLEEDILDTWREHGPRAGTKSAVAEFKGALNLRHWLAHGRYWKPKLGRAGGYDPVSVFDICKQLQQTVELMPPDPTGN